MPVITSVIVEKCVFNFLYFTGGAPNCRGAWGNLPTLLFLSTGLGVLIMR